MDQIFFDIKFNGKGWVDFEAEINDVLEAMDKSSLKYNMQLETEIKQLLHIKDSN